MPAVADPPRPAPPPPPATPAGSVFGTAMRAILVLLLLCVLAVAVLAVLAFASLLNAPNQVAGGFSAATSQATHALSGVQQAVQNATDPNHPPTGLTYDTEFTALATWRVGDRLPDSSQYVFTLQSIQRRQGADSPDTTLYAVVHAELRQPRETRLLGQLIRSDSDPHDYIVYKGESFRIGGAMYRVNWVSQEQNAMAAGTYRSPDAVSAPLKFAYD